MLFSEPKISQFVVDISKAPNRVYVSVLFSEPKISQLRLVKIGGRTIPRFQCSSASRKFLNFETVRPVRVDRERFSALQRAENFSISQHARPVRRKRWFQCSSASRKFLNSRACRRTRATARVSVLFSEPKISQFQYPNIVVIRSAKFQCSSASRKFLN